MRPSKDEYFLKIAEVVATRSTCVHHQYGAVIVKDDEIISTGYNGSPRGELNCCDVGCYKDTHTQPIDPDSAQHGNQYGICVAVHAEQNALLNAEPSKTKGATLYLACLEPERMVIPCNICNRMIKNAGIARLVTTQYERNLNT